MGERKVLTKIGALWRPLSPPPPNFSFFRGRIFKSSEEKLDDEGEYTLGTTHLRAPEAAVDVVLAVLVDTVAAGEATGALGF